MRRVGGEWEGGGRRRGGERKGVGGKGRRGAWERGYEKNGEVHYQQVHFPFQIKHKSQLRLCDSLATPSWTVSGDRITAFS